MTTPEGARGTAEHLTERGCGVGVRRYLTKKYPERARSGFPVLTLRPDLSARSSRGSHGRH